MMQCSFLTRRTKTKLVYLLPVLILHRHGHLCCIIVPHSCGNIASKLFLHQKFCIQWLQKDLHADGSLKDAKTVQLLFNKSAWKSAKNILTLIKIGYLSDPPCIALYYQIGLDSKNGGLPIYRCMCGTNTTEGGVHKPIHSCVLVSGVSPQHLYSCLLHFILRQNLLVRPLIYFLCHIND